MSRLFFMIIFYDHLTLRVNSPKIASFLDVLDTPRLAAGRFIASSFVNRGV